MRHTKAYIMFLLTLFSAELLRGQNITTMGTDFWLSFMRGRIEASMSVTITGKDACTGTISNESGWSQSFSVPANGSVIITIDTDYCYNTVSNAITNKGIHVVTTDTVSVYASNFLSSSFDVSFILPTPALRDEYMVQTFETWKYAYQSEILIIATEDSTTVDIYPTASTLNSLNTGSFSVTLNTGQCYLMQCSQLSDYSGTRIKARDCKRIAVFNGHHCAHIPVSTGNYCDHLFEQSIPVAYWGKHFVATMSSHHSGDYIKITSLKDSCSVYVGGFYATMIDEGESYSFTMTGTQTSQYIETSQPVTVYAYMMSKNVAGPDGDPSMMLIPPIEQQLKDVVFVNYDNSTQLSQYHYVNVVTHYQDVSQMYLDGTSISNQFQYVTGISTYRFARISTSTGSHRLYCQNCNGFVAHAYGVGENESYGYAVGFSAVPLNRHLVVGDNEYAPGDTVHVCMGDTLKAYINSEDSIAISGWRKEGALYSIADTLYVNCFYGDTASFDVIYNKPGCFSNNDTLSFILLVHTPKTKYIDTAICGDGLTWNDIFYDSIGEYKQTLKGKFCDSIVTMNLYKIDSAVYEYVEYSACDSIILNGATYFSNDTVWKETTTGSNGCDSIVMACITINHSYFFNVDVTINEGDTLYWIDGGAYCDESEHPTYNYHSVNGCDSIARLNLHVEQPPQPPTPIVPPTPPTPPPIDSSALWVPNAFTPDENNNNQFCIYGNDLLEAHVYIYDRGGDFITDFDGLVQCWDGTSKGRPCKAETYVYLIDYRIKAMPHVAQKKTGTVTLLK